MLQAAFCTRGRSRHRILTRNPYHKQMCIRDSCWGWKDLPSLKACHCCKLPTSASAWEEASSTEKPMHCLPNSMHVQQAPVSFTQLHIKIDSGRIALYCERLAVSCLLYTSKSVFFINHLIRKLLPALILLPFIPFRLRNWLMDTWYLAAIPPNVSPCLIL